MSATYLLAKYVKDLDRQEPRNIGIIAWVPGRIELRFMDPGSADFITDTDNFKRWLAYWSDLAGRPRIQVFRERPATKKSVRFLRQLQMTQEGNYQLMAGGMVPDATQDNLKEVTAFLFRRLVQKTRDQDEEREPSLNDRCYQILYDAGVAMKNDFKRRFGMRLLVDGLEREIHFDYGRGSDGKPNFLFNRVNLAEENSVILAAGKCGTAIKFDRCSIDRCFSLYDSTVETADSDATVHFLKTFSVPVDIANKDQAVSLLQPAIAG